MHGTIKGLFIENGPQWRGPTCTYLVICSWQWVPPPDRRVRTRLLQFLALSAVWAPIQRIFLRLFTEPSPTLSLVQLYGFPSLLVEHKTAGPTIPNFDIYIYMIFFLTIWYWSKCILAWGDQIWIWFLCMIWNRSELNYVALMSN